MKEKVPNIELRIGVYNNILWIIKNTYKKGNKKTESVLQEHEIIYKESIGYKFLEIASDYEFTFSNFKKNKDNVIISFSEDVKSYSNNKIFNDFYSIFGGTNYEEYEREGSLHSIQSLVNSVYEDYENPKGILSTILLNSFPSEHRFEIPRMKLRFAKIDEGKFLKDYEMYDYNNHNISVERIKKSLIKDYSCSSIEDYFNICKIYFLENNIKISKCKNCGKYFIPNNNKCVLCNYIFKDNKTCSQLSYQLELENNPIKKLHRQNYKNQNAKISNYKKQWGEHAKEEVIKKNEEKYLLYKEAEKEIFNKCLNKEISFEDYKNWLKNNENWFEV